MSLVLFGGFCVGSALVLVLCFCALMRSAGRALRHFDRETSR